VTAEHMGLVVEVWPVAADPAGIWMLSGSDAWRSDRVPADSEPHFEVEMLLYRRACPGAALLHSTSWRVDGPHCVLTYMAVVDLPDLVLDTWQTARPVSPGLLPALGNPPAHGPAEPPAPRHLDVLMHGLRHLRFLLDTDAVAREALGGEWPQHLTSFTPALAGMYEHPDS
jgi:hypothetical protein